MKNIGLLPDQKPGQFPKGNEVSFPFKYFLHAKTGRKMLQFVFLVGGKDDVVSFPDERLRQIEGIVKNPSPSPGFHYQNFHKVIALRAKSLDTYAEYLRIHLSQFKSFYHKAHKVGIKITKFFLRVLCEFFVFFVVIVVIFYFMFHLNLKNLLLVISQWPFREASRISTSDY
jgi:hypothetical protein